MKNSLFFRIIKSKTFFVLFSFLLVFNSFSQETNSKAVDSLETIEIISIGDISGEAEKIAQRISKLSKILQPSTKVKEIDSLINDVSTIITQKKDSLFNNEENISRRELSELKVIWSGYKTKLSSYQDLLKDRTEDITTISDELSKEIKRWEKTKKTLVNETTKNNGFGALNDVISNLQQTLDLGHTRLKEVFSIQNGLTQLILLNDDVLTEIDLVELKLKKDYFTFDSKPIWEISSDKLNDSVTVASKKVTLKTNVLNSKQSLLDFITTNLKSFVFQVLFILFLLFLILRANKNWSKTHEENISQIEQQTKTILSHPIASAIIAGVLISYFFYSAVTPSFGEALLFIILVSTIYLLPKLTLTSFRIPLVLLFISFIIYSYVDIEVSNSNLARWILILNLVILSLGIGLARKITLKNPILFNSIYKFFKFVGPLYLFLNAVAIIGNIIGMVSLSRYITRGVLISTLLGIVVYMTVKVIGSLVIVFFRARKSNIQTLSTIVEISNKRIKPALNWIGFFLWLKFTFGSFELSPFFKEWLEELMATKWVVGEATISLGGILAFTSIIIISLIISKLLATIFQDEWMIKILPRGASSAMSLMLRILVISVGFYLAFTAVGLDLSKLSLIIGALGVGIGFGLQNVVSNFISGLILAFERPINIGDAIEIDQEMGVVTNIGVRSSNIRTYSGAEAIIPNGDLISKKVVNWTLSNRDRRSKILMKTDPKAEPEKIIELFNTIASTNEKTFNNPAPKTYFYGYDENGNLSFSLLYWTTFSDTLTTNHVIALKIFEALKEEGLQAPAPSRRIIKN